MHTNHCRGGHHQDPDETTPSDVSERPSVDDVESDTGSTGALETRSLKDHKGNGFQSSTSLGRFLSSLSNKRLNTEDITTAYNTTPTPSVDIQYAVYFQCN